MDGFGNITGHAQIAIKGDTKKNKRAVAMPNQMDTNNILFRRIEFDAMSFSPFMNSSSRVFHICKNASIIFMTTESLEDTESICKSIFIASTCTCCENNIHEENISKEWAKHSALEHTIFDDEILGTTAANNNMRRTR